MCYHLNHLPNLASLSNSFVRFIDSVPVYFFLPALFHHALPLKSASAAPTGELGSRRNCCSRVDSSDGGTQVVWTNQTGEQV